MRLFDSLFRPKFIGKYLADKVWQVISYFVIFIIICSIPSLVSATQNYEKDVTYYDTTEIFQAMFNDSELDFRIEDNKLNTTKAVYYSNGSIAVAFNTKATNATLSMVFYENYMVVSYGSTFEKDGSTLKTIYYNKLKSSSIDFSLVQQKNFQEIYKLLDYINIGYDAYLDYAVPSMIASSFVSLLLEFGVLFVILMFAGVYFNPYLPRRIRSRIAVYSMSWAFMAYIVGIFIGLTFLFYIGAIVSFVFMGIACRNIVRVKKQ